MPSSSWGCNLDRGARSNPVCAGELLFCLTQPVSPLLCCESQRVDSSPFCRLLAWRRTFGWVEPKDGTGRSLEAGREETPGCCPSFWPRGRSSSLPPAPADPDEWPCLLGSKNARSSPSVPALGVAVCCFLRLLNPSVVSPSLVGSNS